MTDNDIAKIEVITKMSFLLLIVFVTRFSEMTCTERIIFERDKCSFKLVAV